MNDNIPDINAELFDSKDLLFGSPLGIKGPQYTNDLGTGGSILFSCLIFYR